MVSLRRFSDALSFLLQLISASSLVSVLELETSAVIRASLTGKMSEFIEKVEVLEEDWAIGTSSQRVLVVIEGCASRGGDQLWVGGLHFKERFRKFICD